MWLHVRFHDNAGIDSLSLLPFMFLTIYYMPVASGSLRAAGAVGRHRGPQGSSKPHTQCDDFDSHPASGV